MHMKCRLCNIIESLYIQLQPNEPTLDHLYIYAHSIKFQPDILFYSIHVVNVSF